MKMKRLVVDDLRNLRFPDGDTVTVRTCTDAIDLINQETWHQDDAWDEVWLDYDLGFLNVDGYSDTMPIVDALVQRVHSAYPPKRIVLHTQNPVGRSRMLIALARYYPVHHVDVAQFLALSTPGTSQSD
jgi:hypothetical protein